MKLSLLNLFIIILLTSCNYKNKEAVYFVNDQNVSKGIELKEWNVVGPIKNIDSVSSDFLDIDHLQVSRCIEADFVKAPYQYKIKVRSKFLGKRAFVQDYYSAPNSILEFCEIDVNKKDSVNGLKGSAIYFYCKINCEKDVKVFLMSKSTSVLRIWMNGALIKSYKKHNWGVDSDLLGLDLKKGINILVLKTTNLLKGVYFEGVLGGRDMMRKSYHTKNSYTLLSKLITRDTLKLSSNHCKDLGTSIVYHIKNVNAEDVLSEKLTQKSASIISISSLNLYQNYICYFTVKDYLYSQPFFIGDPDSTYSYYYKMRNNFNDIESLQQIDTYLYRIKYLLGHETRTIEWWWRHKLAGLFYELENYCNNLEKKRNININTYGIQLKSYSSPLDNSPQNYLLVSPDNISDKDTLPLVVVLRPEMENIHHFLSSPQLARHWSLIKAKYLANKFKYIIMMPAGRLYEREEFIPMAEKEILSAIDDVQKHFNINKNKIYLHGNCSAGYRCLQFACRNPDIFAAIGLYAPVYHPRNKNEWVNNNSPENLLLNLSNIPIILHYDPLDTHSPYSFFKDFIIDSKKMNIPLTISSKPLSGFNYNTFLVGEEAFSFFKGKTRCIRPPQIQFTSYDDKYNSVSWMRCKPVSKSGKATVNANYDSSQNKISIVSKNIAELAIDINQLNVRKDTVLQVLFNNKIVYSGLFKHPKLYIHSKRNKNVKDNLIAKQKIIADVFAEPFYYVTDTLNGNNSYKTLVRLIINEYELNLFSKCPIIEAENISNTDIINHNLVFIGYSFKNNTIMQGLSKLPMQIKTNSVNLSGKEYKGNNIVFQSIFTSPFNANKLIMMYGTNNPTNFKHEFKCAWKNGLTNSLVLP